MNYGRDPVVEEVRKIREQLIKEFNYDLHAIGRFLAQREKKHTTHGKPIKLTRGPRERLHV